MISITGFALLKIIVSMRWLLIIRSPLMSLQTIFSTELLIVLPTTLKNPSYSGLSMSKFDISKFLGKSSLPDLPSRPTYLRLGNLIYGLPFPDGVTKNFAYIPVVISDKDQERSKTATYTVVTEALVPDFGCEIMDFNLTVPSTIYKHRNLTGFEQSTVVDITYTLPNGKVCDRRSETSIQASKNVPPDGCPSLIFTYGAFTHLIERPDSFTTLVCYQKIEQLDVKVVF